MRGSALVWGWWARAWFLILAAAAWPLVVLAPRAGHARAVARAAARLWVRVVALPLEVRGLGRLRAARTPVVVVVNHTSKLDAIVLSAALPAAFAFVAKAELRRPLWLRWPLSRLDVLFVERGEEHRAPPATARAIDRLRRGGSLVWFPEGTFGAEPGLLPFHRGAFFAASQAQAPVVPIALAGMRAVLPDAQRRPRRAPVAVEIGEALEPGAPDAPGAVDALRERARAFIAAHCGEPDRVAVPAP